MSLVKSPDGAIKEVEQTFSDAAIPDDAIVITVHIVEGGHVGNVWLKAPDGSHTKVLEEKVWGPNENPNHILQEELMMLVCADPDKWKRDEYLHTIWALKITIESKIAEES